MPCPTYVPVKTPRPFARGWRFRAWVWSLGMAALPPDPAIIVQYLGPQPRALPGHRSHVIPHGRTSSCRTPCSSHLCSSERGLQSPRPHAASGALLLPQKPLSLRQKSLPKKPDFTLGLNANTRKVHCAGNTSQSQRTNGAAGDPRDTAPKARRRETPRESESIKETFTVSDTGTSCRIYCRFIRYALNLITEEL